MSHTLEVFFDGELIFHSDRKWLHPLFELEEFLRQQNYDPTSLIIKDKIVGRAAALIQIYLGFKTVKAETMSRLAKEIFDYYRISYEFQKLVEQIQCRTEEMLAHECDPEQAHNLIRELSNK